MRGLDSNFDAFEARDYIPVNTLPSLKTLDDAMLALDGMQRSEMRHLLEPGAQARAEQETRFGAELTAFGKASEYYMQNLLTDDKDKANMEALAAKAAVYVDRVLRARRVRCQTRSHSHGAACWRGAR